MLRPLGRLAGESSEAHAERKARTLARKEWSKFGDCTGQDRGFVERGITRQDQTVYEVYFNGLDEKRPAIKKPKRSISCRYCKGAHFSSRCPNRGDSAREDDIMETLPVSNPSSRSYNRIRSSDIYKDDQRVWQRGGKTQSRTVDKSTKVYQQTTALPKARETEANSEAAQVKSQATTTKKEIVELKVASALAKPSSCTRVEVKEDAVTTKVQHLSSLHVESDGQLDQSRTSSTETNVSNDGTSIYKSSPEHARESNMPFGYGWVESGGEEEPPRQTPAAEASMQNDRVSDQAEQKRSHSGLRISREKRALLQLQIHDNQRKKKLQQQQFEGHGRGGQVPHQRDKDRIRGEFMNGSGHPLNGAASRTLSGFPQHAIPPDKFLDKHNNNYPVPGDIVRMHEQKLREKLKQQVAEENLENRKRLHKQEQYLLQMYAKRKQAQRMKKMAEEEAMKFSKHHADDASSPDLLAYTRGRYPYAKNGQRSDVLRHLQQQKQQQLLHGLNGHRLPHGMASRPRSPRSHTAFSSHPLHHHPTTADQCHQIHHRGTRRTNRQPSFEEQVEELYRQNSRNTAHRGHHIPLTMDPTSRTLAGGRHQVNDTLLPSNYPNRIHGGNIATRTPREHSSRYTRHFYPQQEEGDDGIGQIGWI